MPKVIKIAPEPPPIMWRLDLTDEEARALRTWIGDSSTAAMQGVSLSLVKLYNAMVDAGIKRLDSK